MSHNGCFGGLNLTWLYLSSPESHNYVIMTYVIMSLRD
jgi:hypothetical protein